MIFVLLTICIALIVVGVILADRDSSEGVETTTDSVDLAVHI